MELNISKREFGDQCRCSAADRNEGNKEGLISELEVVEGRALNVEWEALK